MTTKTLKLAMDKAAELPGPAQEEIAREVLERVNTIEQTAPLSRLEFASSMLG